MAASGSSPRSGHWWLDGMGRSLDGFSIAARNVVSMCVEAEGCEWEAESPYAVVPRSASWHDRSPPGEGVATGPGPAKGRRRDATHVSRLVSHRTTGRRSVREECAAAAMGNRDRRFPLIGLRRGRWERRHRWPRRVGALKEASSFPVVRLDRAGHGRLAGCGRLARCGLSPGD